MDGWRWSDAWIFVSVVVAGGGEPERRFASGGAELSELISAADHLNQAIPKRDEIEHAVRRLIGAGLVRVSDGTALQLTPSGERLWRTRPRTGLSTAVDTLHGALNRTYVPGTADWNLDEGEHAAAVQEYTSRAPR